MFGNVQTFGDNRFFDRRLDVRGKLGFHAPYIEAENVVPEEVAKLAYQKGIAAVADLLELDHKGFLNRSFVVDFLRKGPQDSLDLDTVGKAGEWLVELFGYKVPDEITKEMGTQACSNDIAWAARRRVSSTSALMPTRYDLARNFLEGKAEPIVSPVSRLIKLDETRWLFTQPTSDEENEKTDSRCCVVKLQRYQSPMPTLAMRIEQEKVIDSNSLCADKPAPSITVPNKRPLASADGFTETTPAWFLYPPSTPLSSISAN
jgi:hypothetical protein